MLETLQGRLKSQIAGSIESLGIIIYMGKDRCSPGIQMIEMHREGGIVTQD